MSLALKNELERALNRWATCFLKIENEYYYKKYDYGDVVLLNAIGESIFALRSFHSLIIAHIDNLKQDKKFKNNEKDFERITKYFRFFDDLIASKVKMFFFRETAAENINGPYTDVNLLILNTGKELIDSILKNDLSTIVPSIKSSLCKHFYSCSLLYAFLYDPEDHKGFFLHFSYIKKKYKLISNQIRALFENQGEGEVSIKDVRMAGTYIFPVIAESYVINEPVDIQKIKIPDCYKALVHEYTQHDLKIEPLTYHFADIMWKVDSIIHNKDEYLDADDKIKCEHPIIQMLQTFATSYFELADSVYQDGAIRYDKLFDAEMNFIEQIYSDILHIDEHETATGKMLFLSESVLDIEPKIKSQEISSSILQINDAIPKLASIFEKLKVSKVNNYKVETLIENLSKKQLISLLMNYAFLLPRNIKGGTAFVGFYSSGVFLGHIANLINGTDNKPVWLFKARPHIATHPIHNDSENEKAFSDIITFDECFKTGFTYSLYKTYVDRNFPISKPNVSIYSLFDYTEFDKMEVIKESDAYALVTLNGSHYPINVDAYENNAEINIGVYEKSTSILDDLLEKSNAVIEKVKELVSGTNDGLFYKEEKGTSRINLTYLLSNTRFIFSVCNEFLKRIIEELKTKKKESVLFIAPTPEGKVLAFITAFLLRLKDKGVSFQKKDEKQTLSPGVLVVGMDLSVITGFTLSRRHGIYIDKHDNIDQDGNIKLDLKKDRLDSFDLICAIFTNRKDKDNIYAIYTPEKDTVNN